MIATLKRSKEMRLNATEIKMEQIKLKKKNAKLYAIFLFRILDLHV